MDKNLSHANFIKISSTLQTKTFWKFYVMNKNLINVLYFMVNMSQKTDKGRLIARLALDQVNDNLDDSTPKMTSEDYTTEIDRIKSEVLTYGPATEIFCSVYGDLANTVFVRSIDNFKCYLSRLLADVFINHPQMLMSSEKVEVQEVLKYKSKEEFLQFYTDKKINDLSYKSVEDLNEYFSKKHGFNIFNKEQIEEISELFSWRNLIVHNWGKINNSILEKFSNSKYKLGDKIDIGNEFDSICFKLGMMGKEVDDKACDKFLLPKIAYDANLATPKRKRKSLN